MAQEQLLGAFSVALRGRQGREGAAGSQDVPVPGTEAPWAVLHPVPPASHGSLTIMPPSEVKTLRLTELRTPASSLEAADGRTRFV